MARPRWTAMIAGLLCLAPAMLVQLPAVAWQLTEVLTLGQQHDSLWVAHGPRHHRGNKVRVTGAAQGQLRPGTSVPVALSLRNPNSHQVQMMRVRVRIVGIVAPHADRTHPCTTADFAIEQMPRGTIKLPAKRSTSLADLGLPTHAWPWLTMLDRPVNQDGCKGAGLRLWFKARRLRR